MKKSKLSSKMNIFEVPIIFCKNDQSILLSTYLKILKVLNIKSTKIKLIRFKCKLH